MERIISFIQPDEFTNPIYKRLAEIIYDCYDHEIKSPAAIIEKIEDENLKRFTLGFAISEEAISKRWDAVHHDGEIKIDLNKYVDDILMRYKLQKIDEQIRETNNKISETNDETVMIELMKEIKELQEEKKTLLKENQN